MMIEPSIDSMLSKVGGNRYVLCNVIAKRAKEIESVRRLELADQDKKSISIACEYGQLILSIFFKYLNFKV